MVLKDIEFYGSARAVETPVQQSFITGEDSIETPVRGGRSSVDQADINISLDPFSPTSTDFDIQLLPILENLSIYNRHVSFAVNNIMTLGNTDFEYNFSDEVSDEMRSQMITHIKTRIGDWYDFSDGENTLINDLFYQAATFGCVSAEAEIEPDLSGVKRVHKVNPVDIKFVRDKENDLYLPLQRDTTVSSMAISGYRQLNTATYSYIAIQKFQQEPYAIPPLFSALIDLAAENDMLKSFRSMMRRIGMLGFLSVLLARPERRNGEGDTAYEARLKKHLDDVYPQIQNGFSQGVTIGYKDFYEFQLQGTNVNAEGSSQLLDMIKTLVYNGVKQDPSLLGDNQSTTETFGRVLLAKMSKNIDNYQRIVASFLERVVLMDLLLNGFSPGFVQIKFEKPMITDKKREEETEKLKIENVTKKRDEGFIDQNQAAIELGYEEPALPEPLFRANPGGGNGVTTEPNGPGSTNPGSEGTDNIENMRLRRFSEDLRSVINRMGGDEYLYDYYIPVECEDDDHEHHHHHHHDHGHHHHHDHNHGDQHSYQLEATEFADRRIQGFVNNYLFQIKAVFDSAVGKAIQDSRVAIENMRGDETLTEFRNGVLLGLYVNWDQHFQVAASDTISSNIMETYRFYRREQRPFDEGIALAKQKNGISFQDFEIPDAVFDLNDARAIDFLRQSDDFYLGKFIMDPDTRQRLVTVINENYLSENVALDSPSNLDAFLTELSDNVTLEEWKAKRIIQTTMNAARNIANIRYMDQAQVTQYEVVEVNDQLTCPYCRHMHGMVLSVSQAVTKINNILESPPESLNRRSPFATSFDLDEFQRMDAQQLQSNDITTPPYHPNCRGRSVAIIT